MATSEVGSQSPANGEAPAERKSSLVIQASDNRGRLSLVADKALASGVNSSNPKRVGGRADLSERRGVAGQ